jgi:Cu+-exporting ATPase
MFIVTFTADKKVKKYLDDLQKNNIKIIIRTIDFPVTISKICRLYALPEDMVKIIPENIHDIFDEETKETEKISASVVCSGKLSSVVKLLIGVRRIRQSAYIGVSLQLVSSILGLLIGVIYIVMGAFPNITASLLFIYQLLFTVITIFIAKLRKV